MIRKTISFILAVILALAVLTACRDPGNSEDGFDPNEGVKIGVGELSGNISPFFAASDGDRIARSAVLAGMTAAAADTQNEASPDVPSVAESFRLFYADDKYKETEEFTEGGFTAIEFVIKDGVCFSDGTALTADDVLFSLYCLLDPLSEGDVGTLANLSGLNDYTLGIRGISEKMAIAHRILSYDVGAVSSSGDGYSAEDADDMRQILAPYGAEYAGRIKDYILENYCTKENIESLVFPGLTREDVISDEALSNAFALRMWNYGTFLYDYEEDEDGDFVGVRDALGNLTFKATYAAAIEDEAYLSYYPDPDGEYYLDYTTGEYLPVEDEFSAPRFSRELDAAYVRMSRTGVAGFRDIEGNSYTLEGDSHPTVNDFFRLMKNNYTTDGKFDYVMMEKIESVDDFSFSEAAVAEFASKHSGDERATSISGVRCGEITKDGATRKTLTLFFDDSDYTSAYNANFFVVSKAACLDGFDTSGSVLSDGGTPRASEEFFEHLRKTAGTPVSAGAYTVSFFDPETGKVRLDANDNFTSLGATLTNALTRRITLCDVTDEDAAALLAAGDISLCSAPVTKDAIASLDESVEAIYYPNPSYKYLLINPACYKHISARRAIASVLDVSLMVSDSASPISRCVPVYFDSYAGDTEGTFDPTGKTALELFEDAGYETDDEGNLVDPATKEKAFFSFYLLPEEEGGAAEGMINGAIDILRSIGAEGEIVCDPDLRSRVYSEEDVPIYVLAWNIGRSSSLYERYDYTSGDDAVKSCGIVKLYTIGQLDSTGKVEYVSIDGVRKSSTQSDALDDLDEAITASLSSLDRTVRCEAEATAQKIITELCFEIPLCEYNDVCLVRRGEVDPSSLASGASAAKGCLAELWKIVFTDGAD